jgi:hypothetical protein
MKDEKKIFKNSNSFRIIVDFSLVTFYFVIVKKQHFLRRTDSLPGSKSDKITGKKLNFRF